MSDDTSRRTSAVYGGEHVSIEEFVKEKRKKRIKLRYPIKCPLCGGIIFNVFGHHNSITGSTSIDIPEYVCVKCG